MQVSNRPCQSKSAGPIALYVVHRMILRSQPFDALSQVLQFLFHAYQQVPGDDHGEAVLSSLAGQQGQVVHGQPSVLSSAAGSPRRSCTSVTFAAWTVSTGMLFRVRDGMQGCSSIWGLSSQVQHLREIGFIWCSVTKTFSWTQVQLNNFLLDVFFRNVSKIAPFFPSLTYFCEGPWKSWTCYDPIYQQFS